MDVKYKFVGSRLTIEKSNNVKQFAMGTGYKVIEERGVWDSLIGSTVNYLTVIAPWSVPVIQKLQDLSPGFGCLYAELSNGKQISLDKVVNEYSEDYKELILDCPVGAR